MTDPKVTQTIMSNLKKAGGTFAKGAAKKLAPVLGASMIYQEMKEIPVFKQVTEGTEKIENWIQEHVYDKIPVYGWFQRQAKKVIDFIRGNNDKEWYDGLTLSIPANTDRPMGINYYKDSFTYPTMGSVPKLSILNLKFMEFSKSKSFKAKIAELFEAARNNLRSNLTYSIDDVTEFILNNISLYVILKYWEKRLGFMKFEDEQFPQFKSIWQQSFAGFQTYNLKRLSQREELDTKGLGFANTLDLYSIISNYSFSLVLPENMKKWIDHYVGSVFVLDDDVSNIKYSTIVFSGIPIYRQENSELVHDFYDPEELSLIQISDMIDQFRYDTKFATIRSDLMKASKVMDKDKVIPISLSEGWLTKYDDYSPVVVQSDTYKQMIINAYTSNSCVNNNRVRLDVTDGGLNDHMTALLALGALFNNTTNAKDVYKAYGMEAISYSILVWADTDNTVVLPKGLNQKVAITDTTITYPFALILTTDIQSDIYVGSSVVSTTTRVYYPSNEYPLTVPSTSELVVRINVDKQHYGVVPYAWDYGIVRKFIMPLAITAGGYYLFAVSNTAADINQWVTFNGGGAFTVKAAAGNSLPNAIKQCFTDYRPIYASDETIAENLSNASETFGFTGSVKVKQLAGVGFTDMEFDMNNVIINIRNESPATVAWITQVYLPGSDIAQEYADSTAPTDNELSLKAGYIGLSAWAFTALGYCIPMKNILKVTVDQNSNNITAKYDSILMKEDYIPFVVDVRDLAFMSESMIDGLTKFLNK